MQRGSSRRPRILPHFIENVHFQSACLRVLPAGVIRSDQHRQAGAQRASPRCAQRWASPRRDGSVDPQDGVERDPAQRDHHPNVAQQRNLAARKGRQAASSSGAGLLSGGAQRHAAEMYASVNISPSPRPREVGWLANPARCSAAYRKSPELSPVNMRPVRLAPCAPGARPTIRTRAAGSPKPGTGLPQ